MANPIKASDLYQDDGAIQAAINQLKALQATYEALIDSTRKDAVRLEVEVKKMASSTEGYAEALQKAATRADELAAQQRDFQQASKGVEDAIKKTEKAQEQANEAIAESVEVTAEVEKALEKYAAALDDNQVKVAAVRLATQKMNQLNKLEAKLAMSKAGSYNALSAQYSILKIKLNDMTEAERKNTQAGQEMEKQAKDIYDKMKDLQAATGKTSLNVGNYEEAIRNALDAQRNFTDNLTAGGIATRAYQFAMSKLVQAKVAMTGAVNGTIGPLKAFRLALISTGIGAIVVAIGGLVAAFLSTQRGADALTRVLTPLKLVFQGLLGFAQQLSFVFVDRLKAAFSNPVQAIKDLGTAIKDFLLDRIEGLAKLGPALAKIFTGNLKEGFKDLAAAASQASGASLILNSGLAENVKTSYALGKAIADLRIRLREEEIAFESRRAELERNIAADRAIAANTEETSQRRVSALRRAQAESDKLAAGEEKLARMRLQLAQEEAKANDTDAAARLEIARLQGELTKVEADNLNRKRELIAQVASINKEAANRAAADAKAQADAAKKQAEEEAKALEERKQAQASFSQAVTDLRRGQLGQAEQTFQRETEALEKTYEEQKAIAEKYGLSMAALTEAVESERAAIRKRYEEAQRAELEARITQERQAEWEAFEQEQELAAARLNLTQASEAERTRFELEAEKAKLKKMLELNAAYQGDLTDLQIKTIEAQIDAIDMKLSEPGEGKSILDLLGLAPNEQQVMRDAFAFAKQQLDDFMARRVEAANQAVDRSANEVQAAQAALMAEIEANENGFASNVERARKELDLAKQNQKKALDEQRRAQRAQQQIQAATQAANLVTASTKILADFKLPFALLALAVMWGAFATAQVKASQLTAKKYAEGGFEFLDYGGSHASGNDNPLARTRDGRERRAERGEAFAVFNRRATSRYRGVLPGLVGAINQGQLERKIPGLDASGLAVVVNTTDMRKAERELAAIRQQGERKIYTDAQGRTVEVYRNRKTIYHA